MVLSDFEYDIPRSFVLLESKGGSLESFFYKS